MAMQLEVLKNRLFGKGSSIGVNNIKLFPGSNRDSTPEEMAEQISKTLSQIETGDFEEIE